MRVDVHEWFFSWTLLTDQWWHSWMDICTNTEKKLSTNCLFGWEKWSNHSGFPSLQVRFGDSLNQRERAHSIENLQLVLAVPVVVMAVEKEQRRVRQFAKFDEWMVGQWDNLDLLSAFNSHCKSCKSQTEEAPERAKCLSTIPVCRLCLIVWNKFFSSSEPYRIMHFSLLLLYF